ncbi:class I SAM-dependent methyltransferase [Kitasatospora sp. GAS204B]|uniref:class I SAM-dependent methyltransferase n=1 Tax=unclassified Kitasatospora TaxID=2633591 RepID=UPI002475A393|nr:class I SAM-dependent methyltransferase [Kitasatospora sp. GAS204B]MDH6119156.1 O-methyltransferase involved in polyketide biosynthesis [Kitasatospora sp. GAS204B]
MPAPDGQPELAPSALPETALWTLYHRAAEARRPDTVLRDPQAVALVDRIDFPFVDRFGPAQPTVARLQALRAGVFDREVTDFLTRSPRGTVVCLGEGLETQYWRTDNGRARWLGVDLPEAVALRERLLPAAPRHRLLAGSVTDHAWLDEVDPGDDLLITAEGLLMYLQPTEVRALVAACAARLPRATFVFDAVPHWFNRLAEAAAKRPGGYQPPRMPWTIGSRSLLADPRTVPLGARRTWFLRVLALDLPDRRARLVRSFGPLDLLRRRPAHPGRPRRQG